MAIPCFSRVRVTNDLFAAHGAPRGSVGYVVEIYDGGNYEIEVSDANGITRALFAARETDLEIAG